MQFINVNAYVRNESCFVKARIAIRVIVNYSEVATVDSDYALGIRAQFAIGKPDYSINVQETVEQIDALIAASEAAQTIPVVVPATPNLDF